MMKKFLIKVISFIVAFYGLLLAIVILSNYEIKSKANFHLDASVTSIILGNSQPECAYNDSIISNFKNLANPAETYFYNYQKLKELLKQNPHIENVFVEFSNANILSREDEKIWFDSYINKYLPQYYGFLDIEDHVLLMDKNFIGYQKAVLKSMKFNLKRIALNRYEFVDSIGAYKNLSRYKTQSILDTINDKHLQGRTLGLNEISSYDLTYLQKIIDLCNEKDVSIFLVRSPFHKKFVGNSYETDFQRIRWTKFKGVPFLDFKDFKLKNNQFADLQHLNSNGAMVFSEWFNVHVIDSINNKNNKKSTRND